MVEFLGILVVAIVVWYIYSSSLAKKRQSRIAQYMDLGVLEFQVTFGVVPSEKAIEELTWSIASSNGYEVIAAELQKHGGLSNSLKKSSVVCACVPEWSSNLKRRGF